MLSGFVNATRMVAVLIARLEEGLVGRTWRMMARINDTPLNLVLRVPHDRPLLHGQDLWYGHSHSVLRTLS